MLNHSTDHILHVWINRASGMLAKDAKPEFRSFYSFKSMVNFIAWAPKRLKQAFEGSLPTKHRQCSHSKVEERKDNCLRCALGQNVVECPILQEFIGVWDEHTKTGKSADYYGKKTTDDDKYQAMASICSWHMLASDWSQDRKELPKPAFIDWSEGAFQDVSDRMYWDRVYSNLASVNEETDVSDD